MATRVSWSSDAGDLLWSEGTILLSFALMVANDAAPRHVALLPSWHLPTSRCLLLKIVLSIFHIPELQNVGSQRSLLPPEPTLVKNRSPPTPSPSLYPHLARVASC